MNKPDNILILFGSPNKRGFTNSLLNIFLEDLKNKLHNTCRISWVYVYERNFVPCHGCNSCSETGACVLNVKDGYDKLLEEIARSDYVVVASPVYFNGFPAPMKVVIDRCQQRYAVKFGGDIKQSNQKLRRGALVATCGADTVRFFEPLKETTRMFFDCLDVAFTDRLFASNTDDPEQIRIVD